MPETLVEQVIRILDQYNIPECEGVDGFDCHQPAVVHHLASEQDFCLDHFRFWERNF